MLGWEQRFSQLKKFREEYGHTAVPYAYEGFDGQLGSWAERQRELHRRGRLAAPRVDALERVGFDLAASPASAADRALQHLHAAVAAYRSPVAPSPLTGLRAGTDAHAAAGLRAQWLGQELGGRGRAMEREERALADAVAEDHANGGSARALEYAEWLARQARGADAEEVLLAALERRAADAPALLALARLYERSGEAAAAGEVARRAFLAAPDDPRAVAAFARAVLARGGASGAGAAVERRAEGAQRAVAAEALYRYGGMLQGGEVPPPGAGAGAEDGEPAAAEAAEAAEEAYRAAARLDPSHTGARAALAVLLDFSGRWEEAAVEYEAAAATCTGADAALEVALACNFAGFLHASRRDLARAERLYEAALVADTAHVPSMVNLGQLLVREGAAAAQVERGAELLRAALEALGQAAGAEAREARGAALEALAWAALKRQGEPRQGLRMLREALRVDPGCTRLVHALADSRAGLVDWPPALPGAAGSAPAAGAGAGTGAGAGAGAGGPGDAAWEAALAASARAPGPADGEESSEAAPRRAEGAARGAQEWRAALDGVPDECAHGPPPRQRPRAPRRALRLEWRATHRILGAIDSFWPAQVGRRDAAAHARRAAARRWWRPAAGRLARSGSHPKVNLSTLARAAPS
jgi:tetratricopeptide (TPR) repeat protein